MKYNKTITLKDGRPCIIRNGTAEDGQGLLDVFNLTHTQTDYLLTYIDEHGYTVRQEADFLQQKTEPLWLSMRVRALWNTEETPEDFDHDFAAGRSWC